MAKFQGAKAKTAKFGDTPPRPPVDPDRLPPVFSFEFMAEANGYSVDCCDADHRAALASRLFKLSRMTWLEIRQAPRHGLGTEKIPARALSLALPKQITEDVGLLALRYSGLNPMVGYRDGRIFYILFIDHAMNLYDHG